MAGNGIKATTQVAQSWGQDKTDPKLTHFKYEQKSDLATVTLTFDETVKISTRDITGITLQNKATATNSTTVSVASTTSNDGTTLVLALGKVDVDSIKAQGFCVTQLDCFISLTSEVIKDMAGRTMAAVTDAKARKADSFIGDKDFPTLLKFEKLDLNDGKLTLLFDEPVDPKSLNVTMLTLQDSVLDDAVKKKMTLSGGTTSSKPGYTIVIDMTSDDLSKLKLLGPLCIQRSTCSIRLTTDFITDMAANKLAKFSFAFSIQKSLAENVVKDTTPPVVTKATFDTNTGKFVLTFDEPVRGEGTSPTAITLQNSKENAKATASVTLGDSDKVSKTDATTVTLTMEDTDLAKVKANTDLCTGVKNCFLRITNELVNDVAPAPANDNKPTAADGAVQIVSRRTKWCRCCSRS